MITLKKERLDAFLTYRGWTRADLARALNISESHVSLLWSEKRLPSWKLLDKLVKITHLQPDELMTYGGE